MQKRNSLLWSFSLFFFCNYPILLHYMTNVHHLFKTVLFLICTAAFLYYNIQPSTFKSATTRLQALIGGYYLMLTSFILILTQTIFYAFIFSVGGYVSVYQPSHIIMNTLFFLFIVAIMLINGFFRIVIASKRLRIVWRVLLLCCWWIPIFNIFLFVRTLKIVSQEYTYEMARIGTETVHIENADCQTKYPIVLVHGIFFRDWQLINYWGRIPAALERCGAKIFYGKQPSSLPIAESTAEIKSNIFTIPE